MHPINTLAQLPLAPPPQMAQRMASAGAEKESPVEKAEAVQEAFTEFVGKTFFSQMLKAMRKSTDKPAYFHGGQAEEVFRSQLDQTMADEISTASASKLADPLFERQFPQHAAVLTKNADENKGPEPTINDLAALRRL